MFATSILYAYYQEYEYSLRVFVPNMLSRMGCAQG